jgi:RND superfamily putative drug exporter
MIKELGVGITFGVLIDASIVRAMLVPALMAILGPVNWWAPAPLRRLRRLLHGSLQEPAKTPAGLDAA